MRSRKMKDFSFPMFNSQTKLIQKRRNNIVTTKFKRFFLRNKKTIIYE